MTCPDCGRARHICICASAPSFVVGPVPGLPDAAHRVRVELAAAQLANLLRRQAKAGAATPHDTQLLTALDRWSAGDLT